MKYSQISFLMLFFVAYIGNVLLFSSYFETESAPKSLQEIESNHLSESDVCSEDLEQLFADVLIHPSL